MGARNCKVSLTHWCHSQHECTRSKHVQSRTESVLRFLPWSFFIHSSNNMLNINNPHPLASNHLLTYRDRNKLYSLAHARKSISLQISMVPSEMILQPLGVCHGEVPLGHFPLMWWAKTNRVEAIVKSKLDYHVSTFVGWLIPNSACCTTISYFQFKKPFSVIPYISW